MATAQSKYNLAPIESSYVDPGTVQVSQILRQRYDENKSKYDIINRAAQNLKVGPGDQHHKDNALQGIQDGIEGTIRRGNYEMSGGAIDDLATSFATNESLQLSSQTYNKRQQELAYQAEMTAKGQQFLDFNAIYDENGEKIGHSFDTHQSYWTDEGGEVHKDVYKNGVETQLEYSQKMQQMIGTIAKSGGGLTRLSGEFAGLLEYETGVSNRKADKVVNGLYETYLESDEGTQQMRKLTQLEGLTEQEAKVEIISQMRALAQPQVGSVKRWMDDPQGFGGAPTGNANSMVMAGTAAIDAGADSFTNLTTNISEFQKLHRDAAPGSPEKESYRIQMMDAITTFQAATLEASKSGNQNVQNAAVAQAQLFSGHNNKYSVLQPLMENVTNNDWFQEGNGMMANLWIPWSESSAGSYETEYGISGVRQYFNVRDAMYSESSERDELRSQFSDFNALNAAFGTDYTADDIGPLTQLADDYYTYMVEGGDALRDHMQETVKIKQDDRVVFSPSGVTELNKVNDSMGQLNAKDFMFIDMDGTPITADALGAFTDALTSAQANGSLEFGGLIMPNMWSGTQPSIYVNVGGEQFRAIPHETGSTIYGNPLMENIALNLGLGTMFQENNMQVDRMDAGEMPNAEAMNRYTNAFGITGTYDVNGVPIPGSRPGLIDVPGFMDAVNSNTITDWSAQNGLPAAQVMNSVRILKDLEATKLQEVGTIASKRFTAQELRDLNNNIGSPGDKAVFAEALRIWEGMSYNAN
jgi:hypothetical protein